MKGGSRVGQARQTVERLQLGLTLQRLRNLAEKTQEEAAEVIGRSSGRLSQVENGKGALGTEELTRLLDFYGVEGEDRDTVLALGKASRRRQPRLGYLDTLPDSFARFMDLLTAAKRIRWYECGVIPGLVQSKGYVQSIIRAGAYISSETEVAERISFRLALQQVLQSGLAERIEVVFTEDSLMHVLGDPSVMREQILHLLQLLEQHPALSIRIVPIGAVNSPGNGGGMVALEFDTSDPITFSTVIYGPSVYYDHASHTVPMVQLFEQVQALAWNGRDTRSALLNLLQGDPG